jgi:hypothetical protein
MAPKDTKKHMKAEQNKKCKLQPTTDPTPRKTVSNRAPSLHCKCSMQIKTFVGAKNLFYLSKSSSLNHCHHPRLKSKAILCGQSDMETGDIDILTLLFSMNVTATQISQMMEQLKGQLSHLCFVCGFFNPQGLILPYYKVNRHYFLMHTGVHRTCLNIYAEMCLRHE